ncbi:hypothetical protein EKO04_002713 [Ascochyta lentis]|uniref:Zn(2)-C6 fungal-type domain-containing protein n=1 Tax=Ascochyta lentis TaxID=205686 RepID=A0A8H7J956_9PLEO|nr:hypothetical protein EKO04_002713 [Ascochyta lentis]
MTRAFSPRRSQTPKDGQTEARSGTVEPRPARVRTAKACRLCNEKRVKCDASEHGTPCTRCEQRGEPGCTLIQSRRGIYVRKPRRQQVRTRDTATRLSGPDSNGASDETRDCSVSQEFDVQADAPPSESRHARPSTAQASSLPQHDTPSGATDVSSDSRHRDASWSTVFENLLQRREQRGAVVDKGSIAYIGEAFPLGIILDGSRSGAGRPLLHHPGPAAAPEVATSSLDTTHPTGILPEDISYLEVKQAFIAPSNDTLDALITVFLERFFPFYPIVNPQELLMQYKAQKIPWILLHSICFVSATFCPLRILHRAGFDNRKEARSTFYSKAKALFDIGYEGSKIVTLQVSILLSFWGGSPNNHWNFYTWISTGVTIAETIGCHRSMAGLNITPQDRSLLKRLWWILVVRDAACASMHGRPFRINLEHCDVDELTAEDFEYEASSLLGWLSPDKAQLSGLYHIHAAKLALLLRQIVTVRFYPGTQEAFPSSLLHDELISWRNGLPISLQWMDNDNTHADVFRTTLCIMYNHNVILAHIKPEPAVDNSNALSPSSWLGDEVTSLSAQQIASLACSMVTASEDLVPPHELFHGLFIACVVFFVQTRSSSLLTASLGRSGLTNCKMALHAHRNTWDASSWITQIFEKALARPVREVTLATRADAPPDDLTLNPHSGFNNFDITESSGFFFDGFEGWPNHLFLGDLFEPSMTSAAFAPPTAEYGQGFPTQFH